MFGNRTHPPPLPPLDDFTVEQLFAGTHVDELPDDFHAVGELLAAARGPATPAELDGGAAAAASFVACYEASRPPVRRARTLVVAVTLALGGVLSTGTAFAAIEGSLPAGIQEAAHDTLGVVGISVPRGVSSDGDHLAGTEGGGAPSTDSTSATGRAVTLKASKSGLATTGATTSATPSGTPDAPGTPAPAPAPGGGQRDGAANPPDPAPVNGNSGNSEHGNPPPDDPPSGDPPSGDPPPGNSGNSGNAFSESAGNGNGNGNAGPPPGQATKEQTGPPSVPPGQAKKAAD